MVMRTMRANAKWIFYILATAFVGWLAVGQVMEILGGSANVVLEVNGREVSATTYQLALQQALEQARQQSDGTPLTQEQIREVGDRVAEQLVQQILLEDEYRRVGITVSDQELRAALLNSPPPEVQTSPEFQTDGQFDLTKWQQFILAASPEVVAQLQAMYEQQIPQVKFGYYLTADVYVSDTELWRMWRDEHDSVRIALLAVTPDAVPDSVATVTDADVVRYYREHREDFSRPAIAFVSYTAIPRPDPAPADTAAALARARALRAEVAGADSSAFGAVARRESEDRASGRVGGDLGWFGRTEPGFDPTFLAGLRGLRPGQVSQPIQTQFGYHLIRLEAAQGDSVRARHILVPITLADERLDSIEGRVDSLEDLAAEQTDPTALDAAARALGLPLAQTRVTEAFPLQLGRVRVPDVSIWAFEVDPGETSPIIEGSAAYYVFRLDSLRPAGVPPLEQIRDAVAAAARRERKRQLARSRADELAARLPPGPLVEVTRDLGVVAQRLGPFTRLTPPPVIAGEPVVVGAAFGLRVAERSPAIHGEYGSYIIELLSRSLADSSAWLAQVDEQRERVIQGLRQQRVTAYLAGLREAADLNDRRRELARAAREQQPVALPPIY